MNSKPKISAQGESCKSFISDDEFFRQHPDAFCRLRDFRKEDRLADPTLSGHERERYWALLAFRDGTKLDRYFPSWNRTGEKRMIRERARRWMLWAMGQYKSPSRHEAPAYAEQAA